MSKFNFNSFSRYILSFLIVVSVVWLIIFDEKSPFFKVLIYYTIITNLIMALYWFITARNKDILTNSKYESLRLAITVAITITGSLYFIFLHAANIERITEKFEVGKISLNSEESMILRQN